MAPRKKVTTPAAVVVASVPPPAPAPAMDASAELRTSLQSSLATLNGVNLRRYRGETRDRVRNLRDETKNLLASL